MKMLFFNKNEEKLFLWTIIGRKKKSDSKLIRHKYLLYKQSMLNFPNVTSVYKIIDIEILTAK